MDKIARDILLAQEVGKRLSPIFKDIVLKDMDITLFTETVIDSFGKESVDIINLFPEVSSTDLLVSIGMAAFDYYFSYHTPEFISNKSYGIIKSTYVLNWVINE